MGRRRRKRALLAWLVPTRLNRATELLCTDHVARSTIAFLLYLLSYGGRVLCFVQSPLPDTINGVV